MTRDFIRLHWFAKEIDPQLELVYVYTNPKMAMFMHKHWGFNVLGAENSVDAINAASEEKGFVMAAGAADIENMYPHLVEYLGEVLERINNPRDLDDRVGW